MSKKNFPCNGDDDEEFIQDTEGAVRHQEGQGQDEAGENPGHLLRHPHGKHGAVGGRGRTEGAFGGCLTLKLAVNAESCLETVSPP